MSHNVPWIGPRSRYTVLDNSSTWNIQSTDGVDFDGELPQDATPESVDPSIVKAGHAEWNGLKHGGKFNFLDRRHAVIVERWFADANGGATTFGTPKIRRADNSLEDFPAVPFRLGKGDCVEITSADTAGSDEPRFGILVRIEGDEVFT